MRKRHDPNSDIIKKGGKVPANPPPPPSILTSPPDPPATSGVDRYAEERMVYWLQKSNRYREALEDIADKYGDDTTAGWIARRALGRI